jgi:putative ABC transport system permease protein
VAVDSPLPSLEQQPPRRPALGRLGAFSTNVSAALQSLRGNWFRSLLTVLGVVIGVAAVIVLVAFGQGAKQEITGQIDTLGTNVAILMPGKLQGQSNFNPMGGLGVSNLSEKDVEALLRVRGVRAAAPVTFLGGGVFRGDKPASICMPIATTPNLKEIRRLALESGRFIGPEDMDRQVCAIGMGIKKSLFPDEDALGKTISVNDKPFEVIGVVKDRSIGSGLFGGDELDAIVYLPKNVVERLTQTKQIHRVFVEVRPEMNPDRVIEDVRGAMLRAHGGRDDFSLVQAKELLSMFYRIFTMLAALLLGITSISLIVGGIGIMNIMLVSVTERTREIGIRKTVGARRRDIFLQFLTEAVTLSLLGGVLGIALAVFACQMMARSLPLKPVITSGSVLLGFGVCVAVGVISGVLPAISAARLDPIAAIRHE